MVVSKGGSVHGGLRTTDTHVREDGSSGCLSSDEFSDILDLPLIAINAFAFQR